MFRRGFIRTFSVGIFLGIEVSLHVAYHNVLWYTDHTTPSELDFARLRLLSLTGAFPGKHDLEFVGVVPYFRKRKRFLKVYILRSRSCNSQWPLRSALVIYVYLLLFTVKLVTRVLSKWDKNCLDNGSAMKCEIIGSMLLRNEHFRRFGS